jgi:prolyl oligopeptidase PreP (S9A serine peptidase family)
MRGGGEYGTGWRDAGSTRHKQVRAYSYIHVSRAADG